MAPKAKPPDEEPKRLNRAVGVGELAGKLIGPAMRKRGFASRDILTNWAAMAPKPYDQVAMPDKLSWPRGERGAEGATLYLRCAPSHALALSHETNLIAAAVNRYFGYLLVGQVRLSAEPLAPRATRPMAKPPSAEAQQSVGAAVAAVSDDGLRDALRRLGHGIMGKASN